MENNQLLKVIESSSSQGVSSLALSHDEQYLFMGHGSIHGGGENVHIKMWDIKNNKMVKVFRNQNKNAKDRENVFDLALSQNGKYMASNFNNGHDNQEIELWSIETGKLIASFPSPIENISSSLVFTKDSKWLIAGDENGKISFWSMAQKKFIRSEQVLKTAIEKIILIKGNKLLITSKSGVYLRSLKERNITRVFNVSQTPVHEIISSENGEFFATESNNSCFNIWSIHKEEALYSFENNDIESLLNISNDGKELVIHYADESIKHYSLNNMQKANKIFIFGDKKNWVVFDEVNKTMNLVDEGSFLLKKHEVSKDENMTLFEFER